MRKLESCLQDVVLAFAIIKEAISDQRIIIMAKRLPVRSIIAAIILGFGCVALLGCSENKKENKPEAAAEKKVETKAEPKPEPKEEAKEIVFDPRTPPPGYTTCHRNHCHKEGGGVASYKQVMAEIGATKIVGAPKMAPMPKAPSDVAAVPSDAETTASGLATRMLKPGDGTTKPGPNSIVTVHYTGWTSAGKGFDSSISRGRPATLPLSKALPGWAEGIQLMSVGEERRMWVPQNLAFNGKPNRPTGMLVFDVELIGVR